MNVLLIEDEKVLAENIVAYLTDSDFHCEWAEDLEQAREKVWLYTYDCIVVDIGLPDGSGLDVIELLKRMKSKTGIIIVSARNALDDKIRGLEVGADDYLTKPFDLSELVARIRALVRRRNFEAQNEIVFQEITVLPFEHLATVKGQPINLTRKEFELLVYFLSNPNRVITKQSIAEHLWGDEMDMSDSFDFIYSHLKNLRKKIADKGGEDYIETVYGIGYKLTTK